MSPSEKLAFIKDLVERGNPAFQVDYNHSLAITGQDEDGSVKVNLVDEDYPNDEICEVAVDVVDSFVRVQVGGIWMDVNMLLLKVDLGEDGVRFMNAIPHNLFAILYA